MHGCAPRKHRNILISARDAVETDCELRNGKIEVRNEEIMVGNPEIKPRNYF